MFLMDVNCRDRRVAALAVVAALSLGGPLAAAGRETPAGRVSSGDFLSGGIVTRVLTWLGVTSVTEGTPSCDHGSSIDPNGCPKTVRKDATSDPEVTIGPNGHR